MKKISAGLKTKDKRQSGFTLIELLVALAVTGFIISGVAVSIYQIMSMNSSSTNRIYAVTQAQNVGYWVSRDAEMAQEIEISIEENGFPLIMTWVEWSGVGHISVYSLSEETGEVTRDHYIKPVGETEYVLNNSVMVANSIEFDAEKTDCYKEMDGRLILKVTATAGGFMAVSETRQYEIIPRPSV